MLCRRCVPRVLVVVVLSQLSEQNDLYVTCKIDEPKAKFIRSDTHFRAKDGKGNFNW